MPKGTAPGRSGGPGGRGTGGDRGPGEDRGEDRGGDNNLGIGNVPAGQPGRAQVGGTGSPGEDRGGDGNLGIGNVPAGQPGRAQVGGTGSPGEDRGGDGNLGIGNVPAGQPGRVQVGGTGSPGEPSSEPASDLSGLPTAQEEILAWSYVHHLTPEEAAQRTREALWFLQHTSLGQVAIAVAGMFPGVERIDAGGNVMVESQTPGEDRGGDGLQSTIPPAGQEQEQEQEQTPLIDSILGTGPQQAATSLPEIQEPDAWLKQMRIEIAQSRARIRSRQLNARI